MYTIDEAQLHCPRATSTVYSIPEEAAREFGRETIIAELEKEDAAVRASRRDACLRLFSSLWAHISSMRLITLVKSARISE